MKFSTLFFTLSSFAILSCTMQDKPVIHVFEGDDMRTANLPLASSRGINMHVMDERLSAIVSETVSIETQIQTLLARLNALQDELANPKKETPDRVEITENTMPQITWKNNRPEIVKTAEPVKLAPQPEFKPVAKAKPKKQVVTSNKTGVNNVRFGVHNDKTRLVFDINGSTKHTMNFDKEVGIVTLTLPDTKWSTSTSKTYGLSQISGYEAKSTEQGTIIALAVKNTSDIKSMALSKPNRLVIDVMK